MNKWNKWVPIALAVVGFAVGGIIGAAMLWVGGMGAVWLAQRIHAWRVAR